MTFTDDAERTELLQSRVLRSKEVVASVQF